MAVALLKLEEALLGVVVGLVALAKRITTLEVVMKMAAEEAAGMAALLVMIVTLTMMVEVAEEVQDMFILLEQLLIIPPDVY
jgi:hypothetical protein